MHASVERAKANLPGCDTVATDEVDQVDGYIHVMENMLT